MQELFIFLVIGACAIGYVIWKRKRIAALKGHYERLLKGTDRRAALAAGRAYYSALRKGKVLTTYDEQAITNDLSTMGQAPLLPNS